MADELIVEKDELLSDDDLLNDTDLLDVTINQGQPVAPVNMGIMDFSSFEDGIEEISEENEPWIKALVYGKNKTGKTTFAGTFPGKLILLDVVEKGTKSITGMGHMKRMIDSYEMLEMAYWFLKLGKHDFVTVVIDNMTNLQSVIMSHILDGNSKKDPTKDLRTPTKRDWLMMTMEMKKIIVDFRNLDMNVCFIAQEKKSNDDGDLDSDEISVFPEVSPSVRGVIGGAVDVIINTYIHEKIDDKGIKNMSYNGRIGPSSRYLTGCRVKPGYKVPGSLKNPKYSSIIKIMRGEI